MVEIYSYGEEYIIFIGENKMRVKTVFIDEVKFSDDYAAVEAVKVKQNSDIVEITTLAGVLRELLADYLHAHGYQ